MRIDQISQQKSDIRALLPFGKSLADFDKNFIDPIRAELIAASTKRGMGREEAIQEAEANTIESRNVLLT